MATSKQTYTRILQCSPASVGLAQGRPNDTLLLSLLLDILAGKDRMSCKPV